MADQRTEETQSIKKLVRVSLDSTELLERGKKLVEWMEKLDQVERAFASVKQKYKYEIEAMGEEISKMREAISTGKEERLLDCEMVKDFDSERVRYYHKGVLVDQRPMEPAERQMEFEAKRNLIPVQTEVRDANHLSGPNGANGPLL